MKARAPNVFFRANSHMPARSWTAAAVDEGQGQGRARRPAPQMLVLPMLRAKVVMAKAAKPERSGISHNLHEQRPPLGPLLSRRYVRLQRFDCHGYALPLLILD